MENCFRQLWIFFMEKVSRSSWKIVFDCHGKSFSTVMENCFRPSWKTFCRPSWKICFVCHGELFSTVMDKFSRPSWKNCFRQVWTRSRSPWKCDFQVPTLEVDFCRAHGCFQVLRLAYWARGCRSVIVRQVSTKTDCQIARTKRLKFWRCPRSSRWHRSGEHGFYASYSSRTAFGERIWIPEQFQNFDFWSAHSKTNMKTHFLKSTVSLVLFLCFRCPEECLPWLLLNTC